MSTSDLIKVETKDQSFNSFVETDMKKNKLPGKSKLLIKLFAEKLSLATNQKEDSLNSFIDAQKTITSQSKLMSEVFDEEGNSSFKLLIEAIERVCNEFFKTENETLSAGGNISTKDLFSKKIEITGTSEFLHKNYVRLAKNLISQRASNIISEEVFNEKCEEILEKQNGDKILSDAAKHFFKNEETIKNFTLDELVIISKSKVFKSAKLPTHTKIGKHALAKIKTRLTQNMFSTPGAKSTDPRLPVSHEKRLQYFEALTQFGLIDQEELSTQLQQEIKEPFEKTLTTAATDP